MEINNTTFEVGDEVEVSAKFIYHSFGTYIGTFHPDKIVFLIYREGTNSPMVNLPGMDYIILPFGTMTAQNKYTVSEAWTYIIRAWCSATIEGEHYNLITTEQIVVE